MTSTPVYIQAGYAFKPGMRIKSDLDPNAIGHEIAALRDDAGVVEVDAVVDAARLDKSAMHAHFTWDNTVAAESWRKDEARYLLRSIVPIYADTRTEDEHVSPQRAFVALYEETNDQDRAGKYQMLTVRTDARPPRPRPAVIETAPAEPIEPAVFLAPPAAAMLTEQRARALATLRKWADAYGDDPYFAGVVAAVRALG
jgi:hypothetical protein